MIYVDKNNGKISSTQDITWVDDIYYNDDNNQIRTIVRVYKNNKLLWELIIGYLQTNNGFILKTKDNFILKCKYQ